MLAVFGVELDFLIQREAKGEEPLPGAVPRLLEQCLSEIETRGLQEVGLYRIPGASSAIAALRQEFDSSLLISLTHYIAPDWHLSSLEWQVKKSSSFRKNMWIFLRFAILSRLGFALYRIPSFPKNPIMK